MDVLEERRCRADLGFALRTFRPQPYREASPCSSSDLSRAVMESQFLRYVVKEVKPRGCEHRFVIGAICMSHIPALCPQIATETGATVKQVREDARAVLEEMSQNLQLGVIRLMAYTLSKVFKRLFSNIFVNMEGLNTVRRS